MKTFQDLMAEHPSVVHTESSPDLVMDLICSCYATWWGNLTDTHMIRQGDGTYLITGSHINDDFLTGMMYSRKLRGCDLPYTFAELLDVNNMMATFTTHNGQRAVAVGFKDGEQKGSLMLPRPSTICQSQVSASMPCCSGY